jgi:hypothetical protein
MRMNISPPECVRQTPPARGGVAPDPANRNQFFLLRFSRRISVSLRRSRKETAIKQSGVYDARRLSLSSALPVEIADSAIADGQQIFLSTVQYATNLSQSAEQRASRAKKCSAKQRQTTTKMLLGSCLLMKSASYWPNSSHRSTVRTNTASEQSSPNSEKNSRNLCDVMKQAVRRCSIPTAGGDCLGLYLSPLAAQ